GPIDPEVVFVVVESVDGCPIALLANYSLHYVGGVPIGHVSADYYGMFAEKMGFLLGARDVDPPFVCMMTNGTSGDINNVDVLSETVKYKPYAKMAEVAADIANKVFETYQQLRFQDEVQLDAKSTKLTLGIRKPTPQQLQRARQVARLDKKDYYY